MGRHVFFSFDLERDLARAARLRDRWVGRDRTAGGVCEGVAWESVKSGGREGVLAWVDAQMAEASVTVVLIGAQTASIGYVRHAVERAHEAGMGLLGVRIHHMDDPTQPAGVAGSDPIGRVRRDGGPVYTTHDWLPGFSDRFLPDWIEVAAERAGR